jgi:hypothetical protein
VLWNYLPSGFSQNLMFIRGQAHRVRNWKDMKKTLLLEKNFKSFGGLSISKIHLSDIAPPVDTF